MAGEAERTPQDDTAEGVDWHWGPDPAFGNLCRHVGPREQCSGPDCEPEPDDAATPVTAEDSYWQREAQRARAERDALALRLLQMADAWEERFAETGVRVDVVVSAVRIAVENMGGR